MRQLAFSFLTAALTIAVACSCASCRNASKSGDTAQQDTLAAKGPDFSADSAYAFAARQCEFGPRCMNTPEHDKCGEWIAQTFRDYGLDVEIQQAKLKGWDGTMLDSRNIIARYKPERKARILLCAHWDTRPWADNDPDEANWHSPVTGANDGASGVAVMLELARLMQMDSSLCVGVDFVCFDAEDYGTPQWADVADDPDSWALGAQYWAQNLPQGYTARYGILLDMVGGQGARFFQESISLRYARETVAKVWRTASLMGYGSMFPMQEGGMITDDHVPVNEKAGIPCIDIIPFYPDCQQSSFGPTWHTVNDDMQHIDPNTLKAVGQVLVQTLYGEAE